MNKRDFILGLVIGLIISGLFLTYYLNLEKPATSTADQQQSTSDKEMRDRMRAEIKNVESELKNNPNDIALLTSLGNYHFDLGDAKEAIGYYEKALSIQPDNADILVDCGIMYRQLNQFQKSLEYFDKALAIEPNNQQALFNKIIIYRYDLNDMEHARLAFKDLEKYYPDNPHIGAFKADLGI